MEDLKKNDIKNESAIVKNRKQKSVFEKIPPAYRTFHQHVKRAHLQSLIFNQADNAITEIKNPEHFGWKFDGTRYVAIVTDNPVAPDTVIIFASCNCKSNAFFLCSWGGYMITWMIIVK